MRWKPPVQKPTTTPSSSSSAVAQRPDEGELLVGAITKQNGPLKGSFEADLAALERELGSMTVDGKSFEQDLADLETYLAQDAKTKAGQEQFGGARPVTEGPLTGAVGVAGALSRKPLLEQTALMLQNPSYVTNMALRSVPTMVLGPNLDKSFITKAGAIERPPELGEPEPAPPHAKRPLSIGPNDPNRVRLTAEPDDPVTWGERIGDLGLTAKASMLDLVDTLAGAGDIVTGGRFGKAMVGDYTTKEREQIERDYSIHQARVNQTMEEASGKPLLEQAALMLQNPSYVTNMALRSVPTMVLGGMVGAGTLQGLTKVVPWLFRVSPRLAALVVKYAPELAGAIGEGAVTWAQNLEQVRQESPTGLVTGKQTAIIGASSAATALIAGFGAAAAKALGIGDIDTLLAAGQTNAATKRGLVRSMVYGGISEGVFQEAGQSANEQVAQNIATGKPWDQGVTFATLMGAGTGGLMGSVAGVITRDGGGPTWDPHSVEAINKIGDALEPGLVARTPESIFPKLPLDKYGLPKPTPAELSRQQDIEADATTAAERINPIRKIVEAGQAQQAEREKRQEAEATAATAAKVAAADRQLAQALTSRPAEALLAPGDPDLLRATKALERGRTIVPKAVASLPNGTTIIEQVGTPDEHVWTLSLSERGVNLTLLAADEDGNILELASKGKAGADLLRILSGVVAGETTVERFRGRPPSPVVTAPVVAAPTEPVAPAPEATPAGMPETPSPDELAAAFAQMTGAAPPVAPVPAAPEPVAPTAVAPPVAAPPVALGKPVTVASPLMEAIKDTPLKSSDFVDAISLWDARERLVTSYNKTTAKKRHHDLMKEIYSVEDKLDAFWKTVSEKVGEDRAEAIRLVVEKETVHVDEAAGRPGNLVAGEGADATASGQRGTGAVRGPQESEATRLRGALARRALEVARAAGWPGTNEEFAARFDKELASIRTLWDDLKGIKAEGNIFLAIAKYGGISVTAEHKFGNQDEIRMLQQASKSWRDPVGFTKSGRMKRGSFPGTGELGGVDSVLRNKGGLSLDMMREALSQEPFWAQRMGDVNDLLKEIDTQLTEWFRTGGPEPAFLEDRLVTSKFANAAWLNEPPDDVPFDIPAPTTIEEDVAPGRVDEIPAIFDRNYVRSLSLVDATEIRDQLISFGDRRGGLGPLEQDYLAAIEARIAELNPPPPPDAGATEPAAAVPETKVAEAPQPESAPPAAEPSAQKSASDLARVISDLAATKPHSLAKRFGKNGPNPEQLAAYKEEVRQWEKANRAARKAWADAAGKEKKPVAPKSKLPSAAELKAQAEPAPAPAEPTPAAPDAAPAEPAPPSDYEAKKADIAARREALKAKIKKQLMQPNKMGVDPSMVGTVIELITNYAEEGVVEFDAFIRRVLGDFDLASIKTLSPYIDAGWKHFYKAQVSTLKTLEAIVNPPKTAPTPKPVPAQTPVPTPVPSAFTPEQQAIFDAVGLRVTISSTSGRIIIREGRPGARSLYHARNAIKAAAPTDPGKWEYRDQPPAYILPANALTRLTDELGKLADHRQPTGDRHGSRIKDLGLREQRRLAESRVDEGGPPDPAGGFVRADTVELINRGGVGGIIPADVLAEQIEDVARIVRAHELGKPIFILASEPGSGKTYVLGGAIRELRRKGVKGIIYVTDNQELIRQAQKDLRDYEIGAVRFMTYNRLRSAKPHDTEVIIFDEAQRVKNVKEGSDGAAQAKAAAEWMKLTKFTVMASGTPYENPVEMKFLGPTGVFTDIFGEFKNFAAAFGAVVIRDKEGLIKGVQWSPSATSEEDAKAANAYLNKLGIYVSRKIRLNPELVDSRLGKVTVSPADAERYANFAEAGRDETATKKLGLNGRAWIVNFKKRLLEASKLNLAIDEAQSALARGRYPIIFIETKAERKLDIPDLQRRESEWERATADANRQGQRTPPRNLSDIPKSKRGDLVDYGLPPVGIVDVLTEYMRRSGEAIIVLPPAIDVVTERFGSDLVAEYTGDATTPSQNLTDWREGKKPVLLVTMAMGGTGLSLHDKVGDHPTTQINLNLPWKPSGVVQVSQRSARYGLKSKAEIIWIFAQNIPFDRMLAGRIGAKMIDMGATLHGEKLPQSDSILSFNFDDIIFSEEKGELDRDDEPPPPDTPPPIAPVAQTVEPAAAPAGEAPLEPGRTIRTAIGKEQTLPGGMEDAARLLKKQPPVVSKEQLDALIAAQLAQISKVQQQVRDGATSADRNAARERLVILEDGLLDLRKTKTPGYGSSGEMFTTTSYAAAGPFSEQEPVTTAANPLAPPQTLQLIEFPEMVALAEDLMGVPRVVEKFARMSGVLGLFRPKKGIFLKAEMFKAEFKRQLPKLLGHEIGHLVDSLPDHFMKRGNLLGRLRSLQHFAETTFLSADGTEIADAEIREELKALSALWRPWDPNQASDKEKKYRAKGTELYADALSVLLNNPGLLKNEAPTFFEQFFENLETKPEVKQAYLDLEQQLHEPREAIVARRMKKIEADVVFGEQKALDIIEARNAAREALRGSVVFRLKTEYKEKHQLVYDWVRERIKAGDVIEEEGNPRFLLSEYRYRMDGRQKAALQETIEPLVKRLDAAGISWMDFHKALFFDRIILGDRVELANPGGIGPVEAKELRATLNATMTPAQRRVMENEKNELRQWLKDLQLQAWDVGLLTEKVHEQVVSSEFYAPYRVIEHMDADVNWRIVHQIGTLKGVAHLGDSAILKGLSTIRAIETQKMKTGVLDFIDQHHPEEAPHAPLKWNGKAQVPQEPDLKSGKHLVTYYDHGKLRGRHVDSYVANSLNHYSVEINDWVMKNIFVWGNSRIFRPIFTTLNIAFQTKNFARDLLRAWTNRPDRTLGQMLTSPFIMAKYYAKGIPLARARAFGPIEGSRAEAQLIAAEKAGILGLSFNDIALGKDIKDTELEQTLAKHGVGSTAPPPSMHGPIQTPLRAGLGVLTFIKEVGDFIETLPKAAAILEYAGDGQISDISPAQRTFIREKVGSPDFRAGGTRTPISNNLLLFSNAFLQGTGADLEAALGEFGPGARGPGGMGYGPGVGPNGPSTSFGWLFKTMLVNVAPKMAMFAAIFLTGRGDDKDKDAEGTVGWLRKALSAVSEYDMTNYIPIPFRVDDNGNVAYFRMQQSDTGRLIGGLTWKALQFARGDKEAMKSAMQIFEYMAGLTPGFSPQIGAGLDVVQFLSTGNVYDAFRNRNVFTDDEARDTNQGRKWGHFFGYEFQSLGGGIVYKFYPGEQRPAVSSTGWQKIIELPVVSSVVGGWVKVGRQGLAEKLREPAARVSADESTRRLDEREDINIAVRRLLDLPVASRTPAAIRMIGKQVAAERYPDVKLRKAREQSIIDRTRMATLRGGSDQLTEAVLSAISVEQKVATILNGTRTMTAPEMTAWLFEAKRYQVISPAVQTAVIRARRKLQ